MKLTIDTKEDSKEEIKKAIRMLSAIVGDSDTVYTNEPHEKTHHANIFSDEPAASEPDTPEPSSPAPSGGLFGMFGDTSSSAPAANEETTNDTEEEPEEKPEIQVIDY
jgi:hypothetical protein